MSAIKRIISDAIPELLETLLSEWGIGMTVVLIFITAILWKYLKTVDSQVILVEQRADKEIDRLVDERDKLQDHILVNFIPSNRPTNVETTND